MNFVFKKKNFFITFELKWCDEKNILAFDKSKRS